MLSIIMWLVGFSGCVFGGFIGYLIFGMNYGPFPWIPFIVGGFISFMWFGEWVYTKITGNEPGAY